MNPSVSIIMPIYQVERFLEASLHSARHQTLENIEIICVDDGSTDNCPAILDEATRQDKRVRVIHNSNHGYGYSINCGFKAAKGEYLAILEPDDLMPLNALKVLFDLANENNADLVKGDYCEMYQSEQSIKLVPALIHWDETIYNRLFSINQRPDVLVSQIINCTGIFKRSLIEKNNILLSETPGASYQDVGLFFQLFLYAKRVYFTHECTYYYRSDNPNASTKNKGKLYMAENEYIKAQDLIRHINYNDKIYSASWAARWRGILGTVARIDESLYTEFFDYLDPIVSDALSKGNIRREFCNSYQWELLTRYQKGRNSFVEAVRKANGTHGNMIRLFWRFKNDGIIKTVRFIIGKSKRKPQVMKEDGQ